MSSARVVLILGIVLAALLIAAGCSTGQPSAPSSPTGKTTPVFTGTMTATTTPVVNSVPDESWKKVQLETNMGTIVIALDPAMPITAGNFETLVKAGYYDGVIFHRVIDGFMIQGGDPTGTGGGGPGYAIPDEFQPGNRNDRGTVAMANAGPNTGGSQFFINLVNNNHLDTKHPVFGNVVEGMEIVDAIGKVRTTGRTGGDRPLQNVTIIKAEMI